LGLKGLIAVTFEEYQILTRKYVETFQSRLVVSLKDDHIHSNSIKFLVENLHQLEFIRILESKHAYKLTPEIIDWTVNLIAYDYNSKELPEILLKLLISRKVGPNYFIEANGEPILHCACYRGWDTVVSHLLSDADLIVDVRSNEFGQLPHHCAAYRGHVSIMKILVLDGRFDLRDTDSGGESVFSASVRGECIEMASYLLDFPCIDPNTADSEGYTALHMACYASSDFLSLLLSDSRVDDVKLFNNEGKQALHCAALSYRLENLKVLLADPRIDPWAKTLESDPSKKGKDVMELALERRHMDVVKYLNTFWHQREG
jgi:ankyrin repeat protein